MADIKATFGAKGDGVTDDTAAFELAFNTIPRQGTLLLPKGTYVITRVRQGPGSRRRTCAPSHWRARSKKSRLWAEAAAWLLRVPARRGRMHIICCASVSCHKIDPCSYLNGQIT
jgi:hypothetical protein